MGAQKHIWLKIVYNHTMTILTCLSLQNTQDQSETFLKVEQVD